MSPQPTDGLRVGRERVVAYRLRANHLHRRLPAGALAQAARYGVQDTIPRAALLSLHARVQAVGPSAWEDPSLIQLWGPRYAVYVVPAADHAVFTLGRSPRDEAGQRAVAAVTQAVCRALGGLPKRKQDILHEVGGGKALAVLYRAAISGRIVIRWDTRDTVVREAEAPQDEPEEARRELCRRHLRAFGPSTPAAFAWWAGVDPPEARETWRALAAELAPVEIEGQQAAVLRSDVPALLEARPVTGVRFLPAEELKLFGQDRTGLFAGPGRAGPQPPFDWHHPNGLLVDGRLVGAWGRRAGRVEVQLWQPLDAKTKAAAEAEARTFPIPDAEVSVQITEQPLPLDPGRGTPRILAG